MSRKREYLVDHLDQACVDLARHFIEGAEDDYDPRVVALSISVQETAEAFLYVSEPAKPMPGEGGVSQVDGHLAAQASDDEVEAAVAAFGDPDPTNTGYRDAMRSALTAAKIKTAEAVAAEREACAQIAATAFGGPAHTYASENADVYRAQDDACARIAAAIRARGSSS